MRIKFKLAGRENEIILKRKRSHGSFVDEKSLDKWYKLRLVKAIVGVIIKEEHFDFNSLVVEEPK